MNKKLAFCKMVGAGNDFIILDHPARMNFKKLAPVMCDRTNGIGADGLLVLSPSRKTDFRMRIINADGSEAEMCGNGARCMAAYIVRYKKPKQKLFGVETIAGLIMSEAKGQIANVHLSDPLGYKESIKLKINKRVMHLSYIDTGVPHVIVFVDSLMQIPVNVIGEQIRYHKNFSPRGTNVNFVEQLLDDLVAVRTYERGVEGETKACGTGSVAAALVNYLKGYAAGRDKKKAKMKVLTQSGETLFVTFDVINGQPKNVWLKGSAKFIAKGEYFIK
ncbi:MAG: diaminopimelate epimerase [Candidatus Omnitrophica bacterium]|nr:diaminopimelate epimerase [Candidatus Omnitrophota bacterium]